MFAVFGALIVFATFIVNEEKIERKKGILETIDSASTKFDLLGAIGKVQFRVDQLARAGTSGSEHDYTLNADAISLTQSDLDAIEDLLSKVPIERDKETLESLQGEFESAHDNALRNEPSDSGSEADFQAANDATDALISVSGKVTDLKDQVITDAKASYSQMERNFEYWRMISIALYLLGWGMGLVGTFIADTGASPSLEG
jgi:hypothetical protein